MCVPPLQREGGQTRANRQDKRPPPKVPGEVPSGAARQGSRSRVIITRPKRAPVAATKATTGAN